MVTWPRCSDATDQYHACRSVSCLTILANLLEVKKKKVTPPPSDYVERTNAAIDWIVSHLADTIDLKTVADVAGFSAFHFHRIFRSLTGETLNQFVKRVRLERALYLMSHVPGRSLTDVALDCGFTSSSDFSRSFRKRFGSPPSTFDLEEFRTARRTQFEETMASFENGPHLPRLPAGENPDGFSVAILDLPPRTVAYIRVLNPYQTPDGVTGACQRLIAWAAKRGLDKGDWLGYMWEDP